jgi:hypothetical protein
MREHAPYRAYRAGIHPAGGIGILFGHILPETMRPSGLPRTDRIAFV